MIYKKLYAEIIMWINMVRLFNGIKDNLLMIKSFYKTEILKMVSVLDTVQKLLEHCFLHHT